MAEIFLIYLISFVLYQGIVPAKSFLPINKSGNLPVSGIQPAYPVNCRIQKMAYFRLKATERRLPANLVFLFLADNRLDLLLRQFLYIRNGI